MSLIIHRAYNMRRSPRSLFAAAGALSLLMPAAALAQSAPQGVCIEQYVNGVAVGCNYSGGGGGSNNGSSLPPGTRSIWEDLADLLKAPDPAVARAAGVELNNRAIKLFETGDWAGAIPMLEQALAKFPDDPIIQKNLTYARERLTQAQAERARIQAQERDLALARNIQGGIQNFAQTLNAAPSSGGLDFDGRAATGPSGTEGLDFAAVLPTPVPVQPGCGPSRDSRVVDACNVPSGLPRDVEDAISGGYANTPPGVSDRVRKGAQAVMTKDWAVAKAWFQDALRLDPNNAALKRLVEITEYSSPERPAATPAAPRPIVASEITRPPSEAELNEYFRKRDPGEPEPVRTKQMRLYIIGMPNEEFARRLGLRTSPAEAAQEDLKERDPIYYHARRYPGSGGALSHLPENEFVKAFVTNELKGIKNDPIDVARMDWFGEKAIADMMYRKGRGEELTWVQEAILNGYLTKPE